MTEALFRPAIKHDAKLRLALSGPSGSGKTYTALRLATVLAIGAMVGVFLVAMLGWLGTGLVIREGEK